MADGSVIIGVNLDTKDADKELAKLKKDIQSTEDAISQQEAKKSPLTAQAEKLNQEMRQARAEVQKFGQQWAQGVAGADIEQAKAQDRLSQIKTKYEGVVQQIDKIDKKLSPAYEKLDGMKERAGGLEQQIAKSSKATERMKEATAAAEDQMGKFVKRVKNLAKRVFVFTLITTALRSLRTWLWDVIKTNDDAVSAVARLKGALLTLAQPIVEVIVPAFTDFVNILAALISKAAEFTSALFGKTVEESADAAEALEKEKDAIDGVSNSAKKASKQLASFDEINKLGSNDQKTSSEISPDFSSVSNEGWLDTVLGDVSGKVASAILLGGVALVAIGASMGNISMVITGLGFLGVGVALASESNEVASWADALGLNSASELVSDALILGGIAIVAIGAMMGNIFAVLAGLGMIGGAVAFADEETKTSWVETLALDSVFDYVTAAMQLAGIALIAIGAAMGNIYMVVAGGLILGLGVAADAIGEEKLKDWWEVLKLTTVQQWIAVALLLVGIALIAIGAATANIAMLIAGAVMLAVSISSFSTAEGSLKDWVTTLGLEKVAGWVTAALMLIGIALVVFGIFTGNIMMILAGAAMLGAGIAVGVTSGTFSAWLNTISTAFAGFKDRVLNIFNQLWGGMKSVINSILGGVEWMANKVISGINWVIDAINRIHFDIPDWLGGGSFGFNIKRLNAVSIPRLAEGAVIPPNREFMAVLGDQKSGTNIETPLETMVQAFRMALQDMGGGTTTVVVTLDGKEVARNQVKHINDMTRQAGKPVLLY